MAYKTMLATRYLIYRSNVELQLCLHFGADASSGYHLAETNRLGQFSTTRPARLFTQSLWYCHRIFQRSTHSDAPHQLP